MWDRGGLELGRGELESSKKGEGLEKNWGLQALVGFCAFRFFCCFSQKFISLRFYFFIPDFLIFMKLCHNCYGFFCRGAVGIGRPLKFLKFFFPDFLLLMFFLDVSFFSKIFF